jgi:hypothetical protein
LHSQILISHLVDILGYTNLKTLRALSHVVWSSNCTSGGCELCQSSSSSTLSFTALSSLLQTSSIEKPHFTKQFFIVVGVTNL